MVSRLIIGILSMLLLIGCSAKRNFELIESNKSNRKVTFQIQNANIPTDTLGMQYYRRFSIYNSDTIWYYIGYHGMLNALDLYNISGRKYIKRIMLEKNGPNQINSVRSIYIHTFDSIFINEYNSIVIIDTTGKVKKRFSLIEKGIFENNNLPYGLITSEIDFKIAFLSNEKSVLTYYVPREFEYFSSTYLETPFICKLNLGDSIASFSLLPVKYSDYYYAGEDVGFGSFSEPNVTIQNNELIFNFPIESNIYKMDLASSAISKFGATSSYTKNLTEPFSDNGNISNHLINNSIFFKVIFDPYKKLYYRIHWGDCEIKKNSLEYNTPFDKKLYLMVFDQSFNLLNEYELEAYKYIPYGYFVTNEGLFLSTGHPNNNEIKIDNLQLDLYSINYEE